MKYRIYPLPSEFDLIKKAAAAKAWASPSSFIIRASVDEAVRVLQQVYALPGSPEFQQQLILRAIKNGCYTLPDICLETGLEPEAASLTVHELVAAGKLVKKEIDRKRQGPKLLPLFILNE